MGVVPFPPFSPSFPPGSVPEVVPHPHSHPIRVIYLRPIFSSVLAIPARPAKLAPK